MNCPYCDFNLNVESFYAYVLDESLKICRPCELEIVLKWGSAKARKRIFNEGWRLD
jgi:hypothetical protein